MLLALVGDLAGVAGALREQAEHAAAERRLAAARLADQADGLAGHQVEADAVDGAHGAALVAVPDAQVAQ